MAIRLTLLGTGTSAGVPMIGCTCEVCTSPDPRDRRDRAAAMVQYLDHEGEQATVLIDTAPELRPQMLRHRVMAIEAVVYTHNHADHVFGIDDLRRFNAVQERALDVYAEPRVIDWLHHTFAYIFESHRNVNKSFVPTLIPRPIEPAQPFELAGQTWLPMRLMHGRLPVLGFRVGAVAYCTDCSAIPPETWPLLADLDVLVIDALRYRHHPTHLTVEQALQIIEQVRPRRAYFTHIAHEIRHADLESHLPDHVHVGYDGIAIESDA